MKSLIFIFMLIECYYTLNKCGHDSDCSYAYDSIICYEITEKKINCSVNRYNIFFKLKKNLLLTRNNLNRLVNSLFLMKKTSILTISSIVGFEENVFNGFEIDFRMISQIYFVDSHLFMSNNSKCIFKNKTYLASIPSITFIQRIKYTKICPNLFSNLDMYTLEFHNLADTFIYKNMLKFLSLKVESTIRELKFMKCENLVLDSSVFHQGLFSQVESIDLDGKIKSIQRDLFENMTNLKYIRLNYYFARNLFHQGFEWIKSINKDLNILENKTNLSRLIAIEIAFCEKYECDLGHKKLFPEEDFCLYTKFPFNQLTLLIAGNMIEDNSNIETCTFNYLKIKDLLTNQINIYNFSHSVA
ncbi:unnamed protein product [Brachionus calyciflorus]|uniref:Uncharacterized protein n=1 Tax=Brachionus calyciflorus TaxID=104777 RepID=A0A814I8B1_9BILA|nr:unnamed protein product [Brachionus calyciflorus]